MGSGVPLPLIPANRFSHELSFRKDKLGKIRQPYLQVRVQNVFRQGRIDPDELVTPAYNLLSMGIGGNILVGSQVIELGVAGNNLLNASYVDHLSLLRPFNILNMGRNIALNVRLPFQIR
jgi:iron complex outermembrane recepter protein